MTFLPSADFHAQHGAFGAYGSFTLGKFGTTGGFAVHDGRSPGHDNVFIGTLAGDGTLNLLPFCKAAGRSTEAFAIREQAGDLKLVPFPEGSIRRRLGLAIDRWETGNLSFEIRAPFWPVPDPASEDGPFFARCCLPALTASLRVHNTTPEPLLAIFGISGDDQGLALLHGDGYCAFTRQSREGWAVRDPDGLIRPFAGFSLKKCLGKNLQLLPLHLQGVCAGFTARVEPGQDIELQLALGWHIEGTATTGLRTHYAYTRHYTDLTSVLETALSQYEIRQKRASECDSWLECILPSADRRFLLAHATQAYLACSELLQDDEGTFRHVVNEGEYCMMNTLDLSVDQLFFEELFCPWATRSVLDLAADRYAYRDRSVTADGSATAETLSFTHDAGIRNVFMPAGHSCYEVPERDRCFSFMSCEELCNWILLSASHVLPGDGRLAWAESRLELITACQQSLLGREHPDPSQRRGTITTDSSRCGSGREITTYDALDPSLAHALGSVYIMLKVWASHLGLALLLERIGQEEPAAISRAAAGRFAAAVLALPLLPNGCLPASSEGSGSAVIPAVEPLIYPWWWGDHDDLASDGPYAELIARLRDHFIAAVQTGVCRTPEGAWRLSSTSDMTWMSKSFLCATVAEEIFHLAPDAEADAIHARWQREGMGPWGFTDQIMNGKDVGSRLYPRGVTAWLWTPLLRQSRTC